MEFRTIKFKHLVSSFLSIMESGKVFNISLGFSCVCIFLGFTQNLSYIFKMRYKIYSEQKLIFLTNGLFYLNYSNLLYYVSSKTLTYIFFIALQIMVYLFIAHLIIVAIMKKHKFYQVLRSKYVEIVNLFFQVFVTLFYWSLLVPFLEIFSNLMDCDWYSYFPDFDQGCPHNNSIVLALSVIGMIAVFVSGVFILWLYRTYIFLDKALLKKKFTFILLVIYLCKVFLVCLWPIYKSVNALIFIILHLIGIFSIYDYIMNFPITNTILSKFYISVLMSYEILCIIFTLDCYSKLFEEDNLFYIIMIVLVFSIKFGLKLFEKLYFRILILNFENFQFLGFSLEELHRLHQNRFNSNQDLLLFCGMLKFHIRKCGLKDCVLTEKKIQKFESMNVEEKEKLINRFISEMFLRNIKEVYQKNIKKNKNFDSILLKYCSFLTNHNNNSIKSYYEIQHILSLNLKKSFYFQSISLNLLRIIESLIKIYEFESKKNNENILNEKEIDLQSFFDILKEKDIMKSQLIHIFEIKIDFWEQYKTGLNSYQQIIQNINKLMSPVREYQELIDLKIRLYKSSQKRIFALKFKIMFTCFILNTVNECIKVEDELEKLKKKELTLEKNIINCNSFFYGNVVTIHASFLKSTGTILDSSKNIKLAQFFDYSLEEIKSMKNIESLMPQIIAKNHSKFIHNFMNRPRSKKDRENVFVPTYALAKNGFIFPIKKYVGLNFDMKYNVILHAALLDLGQASEKMILFDNVGNFQGTTEHFFKFFFSSNHKITKEHILMFNVYNFIPDLGSIIDKNQIFKDKSFTHIINQSAPFYVPDDFTDILDVLTVKVKEENESKSHKSYYSARSEQTKKSSNQSQNNSTKNSRFISKFFKTKTVQNKSIDEKQFIEKKFIQNKDHLTNYDILKELIDISNSTKFYVNFNIYCHHYKISKNDEITLALMFINKITRSTKNNKDNKEELMSADHSKVGSFSLFPPPPSTFKDSEGVKSNFIQIPPENQVHFNSDDKPIPDINHITQNMMTTENDYEDNGLIKNQEFVRKQTLSPPKPQEKKFSVGFRNELMATAGYQTVTSNLSLPENKMDEIEKTEKKKKNSLSNTDNFVKTISSAHKIKLNEVTSHHSSISNIKKTFSIFGIIKMIQNYIPPSLRNFTFCQILELIIIMSYCFVVYFLNVQYIDKYYNPLEDAISSLSQIYNSYAVSSLVTVRYEFQKYNYASSVTGDNAMVVNKVFGLIFNQSFDEMKSLTESERSKQTVFDYQILLKTIIIQSTNLNAPLLINQDFLDFLDQITEIFMTIINVPFEELKLNLLEYLPVNYLNFLDIYSQIVDKINSQFYSSNHDIRNTIETIMIILIIITSLLKILETIFMMNFTNKIIRVINIFLRVNQNEAFNELMFSKEILQNLKDPSDSYLNILCTEKLMNRKAIKLNDEDINKNSNITRNSHKKQNKRKVEKKNLKKFSFHNMKALSNWPLYNYILFTFLLLFTYIFFNYYYASTITDKIDQLIGISIFFENLYTLPTTTIMLNRIIVREKIVKNVMYNFPNPEQREKQLYQDLQYYINDLYNISETIPSYSLTSDILQSRTLQLLIYGDICQALLEQNLIDIEQKSVCDTTLNGAFTKGLLNVITELINTLNGDDSVCKPISFSDLFDRNQQIQQIFSLLKTNTAIDRILTEYYLNKALMLFNTNIQSYYVNIMLTEMNNLKVVVLTTGIVLFLFFTAVLYFAHKYLQKIYANMTMVLNLIPYEKMNNDDQTLFLIKKFWRG